MQARWIYAAVVAAVLVGATGVRAQSGAPRPRPRVCAGDCAEERAERLRELARARAELTRLVRLMAQRGDSIDPAVLASVRAQLAEAMQTMEQLEVRVVEEQNARRMIVARVRSGAPAIARDGWLGISFSSNFQVIHEEGEPRIFRFQGYPVVEAVEPASPAKRAGIEVGDVLIAFHQKDLRAEPIELEEMLVPGSRLPVLLKRGSGTKRVTVVVGERPRTEFIGELTPLPPAPSPRGVPAPAAPPVAPVPPAPMIVFTPSAAIATLAGAEMARLPVEMREQVGADRGLLVLRVAHGTPAARSGLRDGDVIVSANGAPIRSSGDLRMAFSRARQRAMTLEVVRRREVMTVRMTW